MNDIRTVAKKAGVSIATVSRCFNNPEKVSKKTARKVKDAIDEVGYSPNMMARNFRATKSYQIVVLVPQFTNLFFSLVIRSIQNTATKYGYNVLLGETNNSKELEREYVKLVETRQAEGIVQLRTYSEDDEPLSTASNIHVVSACGAQYSPYLSVKMDHIKASKTMVNYLISLGHKKIGCILSSSDNQHTHDRFEGYKDAMEQAGLEIDDTQLYQGDFSIESGYEAGNYFANLAERPTAVFCMNDDMAIGAIKAWKEHGIRVPEDISITGYDDLTFASYSDPSLTTIRQPTEEMGRKAVELLMQQIEGKVNNTQSLTLKHELVVRDSVKPCFK